MLYVFIRAVPMILIAGLAFWVFSVVREWRRPEEQVVCTLSVKRKELITNRVAVRRRDHTEYALIFACEDGKSISVSVSEDVYQLIPKGTAGTLCHRSSIFRWFQYGDVTVYYYSLIDEDDICNPNQGG